MIGSAVPSDWILARRTKLLVSEDLGPHTSLPSPNYRNQVDYDSWDYEFSFLEKWHSPLVPASVFFNANGVMDDGSAANWITRPTIDQAAVGATFDGLGRSRIKQLLLMAGANVVDQVAPGVEHFFVGAKPTAAARILARRLKIKERGEAELIALLGL